MIKSLTETLKKETRREHAHTEGMMNAKAMFSDDYDIEVYKSHLKHLYAAHVLVNALIEKHIEVLPTRDLLPINRSQDLRTDLEQLDAFENLGNPEIKDDAIFSSLPGLIGLIYVIKGSELGGNVIGKQIEKHRLKWNIPSANFYKVSENETLFEDWKHWCDLANNQADSKSFIETAVKAAKEAFQLFENPQVYASLA